eukprot:3211334-Prymnesium_polylepis.1
MTRAFDEAAEVTLARLLSCTAGVALACAVGLAWLLGAAGFSPLWLLLPLVGALDAWRLRLRQTLLRARAG